MEFRTDAVFAALRAPLELIEDAERRAAIERYLDAARLPLERSIYDLLARLADGVEEQSGGRTQVRLVYRSGALDMQVEQQTAPAADSTPSGFTLAEAEWINAEGEMEKVTIRIPAALKERITQSAGGMGLSVNNWLIRALAATVRESASAAARSAAGPQDGDGSWRHGRHERRRGRGRDREDEAWPRSFDTPQDAPTDSHGEATRRSTRLSGWIGQ